MTKTRNDEIYEAGVKHGQERAAAPIETAVTDAASAPFGACVDLLHDIFVGGKTKEEEIYDSGVKYGETHPASDSSSDSCCYITSACLDDLGFSRNCLEMKAMKTLVKEHVLKTFSGKKDYVRYGKIAPKIVKKIRASSEANQIWKGVYANLQDVRDFVAEGNLECGYQNYKQLVSGLEEQFIK